NVTLNRRGCAAVISGPFVLTDLSAQPLHLTNQIAVFVATSDDEIKQPTFLPRWQAGPGGTSIERLRGLKLFVNANEKLYVLNVNAANGAGTGFGIVWSGFRPY